MNDFICLMQDPAYKQREREVREDAERKQRERVARNTARDPVINDPARIRDMITKGRSHSYEHAFEASARYRSGERSRSPKGKAARQATVQTNER